MPDHEELMARARAGAIARELAHREKAQATVAAIEEDIRRWSDDARDYIAARDYILRVFDPSSDLDGAEWKLDGVELFRVSGGFDGSLAYEVGEFGGTYSVTLAPRSKWYGRTRERWWLLLWALKHPRGMWREWRDG